MATTIFLLFLFYLGWSYSSYWGIVRIFRKREETRHAPFGYKGLPGIGFLVHFRGKECQRKLIEMKERCGNICRVRMGSFDCVWLNDYKLIKDAWSNNAFCGRPNIPGITLRTKGFKGGIIFNDGKDFTEQRRFVIQHLKDVGLGKSIMENYIMQEVAAIISTIEKESGSQMSTDHLFNIASFNVLWRMVTGGAHFAHNDSKMSQLVEVLNRNMALGDGAKAAFFMPWLSKYIPWFIGWKRYIQDANYIFDFWMNFAEQANNPDTTDGFLHSYFTKIKECDDPSSSFYKSNGVQSLATVLQDIFIAGTETTAVTLQWTFLYLAAFPSIQKKVADEVQRNFGSENLPTLSNILGRLPYTEAFLKEVLRYSTLAPLGMLHCTTQDVLFHGFFIPKNTIVQTNVCAVHFDKSYWENPQEFDPERFLQPEQNTNGFTNRDAFIPFSSGKRSCPGMELAKQTLFLTIVSLIQKFDVRIDSTEKLELRPKIGVSATPYPHKLMFISRRFNKYNGK